MRFHYIASHPQGKIVEGDYEGSGPAEILEYLAKQGLRPISLKKIKGVEELKRGLFFGRNITIDDKIFLTKYLALMLRVGTDLFKAIDILIADLNRPAIKAFLMEVRDALKKGQPFYSSFLKYPKYFSSVFVNLIKAGETSGNLENIFEELSVFLQKERDLRRKIKSALTYPIILVFASLSILLLLVTFALPKMASVFMTTGVKPPTFSRIVLTIGLFIGDHIWFFPVFLAVSGILIWYLFFKNVAGRKISRRFIAKIPVVKNVLKQLALQHFSSTLASLIKANIPILEALEITAQAVGSEEIKDSLIRISREGVAKGLTIGEAFRKEAAFPRMIVNLMVISETAGRIEDVLKALADFYESETEISIKTLVTFLEPALLLGMGLIIGTIALAVIIPIYQLVGQF
ncbi:hypothetical protein COS61_01665 [Candidatus Wolfebacteria bacterium CG03_land_8_20_14_0_80_40_12]|uniref:Type II secretion system protein GspF domain-containing protein n=1 Tax=Candidatus Wolfebacteria bacterium CG03_land_8_20_14_0_80_40_12 TaxID=1975069 RepID=A0A2M7B5N2_9BACT|nr:MAG: hypothetical protein COS61_01665 [Candidatus Wolfebacteria bacterium CG03_land_8_20_14_0_80_40_12]